MGAARPNQAPALSDEQVSLVLSGIAVGEPFCCASVRARCNRATVDRRRSVCARIGDECYQHAGCRWAADDPLASGYVDSVALALTRSECCD